MRFLLLFLACLVALERVPRAQNPSPLVRAFDQWLAAYQAGKYELQPPAREDGKQPVDKDVAKDSVLAGAGLLKGVMGRITRKREVEILVDKAVEEDSAAAAQRVLQCAAVGLDGSTPAVGRATHLVRETGERGLVRFKSAEAKNLVLQHAKERKDGGEGKDATIALQAAALRALGAFAEPSFRPILEAQLGAPDERLRIAAADGLGRMASPLAVEALSKALENEQKDAALIAVLGALDVTFGKHEKAIDAQATRAAMQAACTALGRGSWRSDVALIDFVVRFRTTEIVSPLIAVLERFAQRLDDVKAGKVSLMLRHRAQNALVALTGAFHPADKPQEWRDFWEKNKESFKIAPEKDAAAAAKGGTVAGGFFGIAVEGSRIVFVLDVSGSMGFPHPRPSKPGVTGAAADQSKNYARMDALKDNLIETLQALPPETKFAIVKFSVEVDTWPKTANDKDPLPLLEADAKNKKAAIDYVKALKPEGGTNLFAGMKRGLELKSVVRGQRYESNIDELFILSDGLPSVGEIVDPDEILKIVAETNRFARVRINTVYIGSKDSPQDRAHGSGDKDGGEFMEKLAQQNHGKFVRKEDK